MKWSVSILLAAIIMISALAVPVPSTVGFEIGTVTGYKLLNSSGLSKYY